MKESSRKAAPVRVPFVWICVVSVVFIILKLVRPGTVDRFSGVYISNTIMSWRRPSDICSGNRIYMYDLPHEFNVGLYDERRCNRSLIPWMDLCRRFGNGGYGLKLWGDSNVDLEVPQSDVNSEFDRSSWYDTDSYMLEVIFHNRMKKYHCLTNEPSVADAFFIPYYAGLHALVHLYPNRSEVSNVNLTYEKRKNFGMDLITWLEENEGEAWRRHGGRDHFLVLGRTTWDFKLFPEWGTGFSALPYVANMTRLLMERDPYEKHEQGIPYVTSFHPSSPERLQSWISGVMTAERKFLFSYVGAPRSDSQSMRGIVGSSCVNAGESVCKLVNCSVVRCSHDPESTYKAFLQSNFCLQPRGDSATRRSTFDCLISGAIPVFFHRDSAYSQYSWHLPHKPESYSVHIPEKDIKKGVSIQQVLMTYSQERITEMRRTIVSIIPNLLYNGYANDPWSPTLKDAFELSIAKVLDSIATEKNYASTFQNSSISSLRTNN